MSPLFYQRIEKMHIFFGTNGTDDYISPLDMDFKYEQMTPTPFLPHISSAKIQATDLTGQPADHGTSTV
jgi:hypothetical protein